MRQLPLERVVISIAFLTVAGRPQRAMQGRHSRSGKGRFDNLVGVIVGKCDQDNDWLKQKAAQLSGNESK